LKIISDWNVLFSRTLKADVKVLLKIISLKKTTKDQIQRLVKRIEIDKDKKIYVYLKFPELVEI
jgi:hypothetical protein